MLLRGQGELDEAIAEFREAARLDRDVYGVAPALSAPAKNLADAEKTKSLQGQLPALQKGDFKPKTEDELRRLFRLCTAKGLYRTGRRMGADAFAADASLAADLNTGDRYDAACCAARAGCGDGADAKDLDDRERAGCASRPSTGCGRIKRRGRSGWTAASRRTKKRSRRPCVTGRKTPT